MIKLAAIELGVRDPVKHEPYTISSNVRRLVEGFLKRCRDQGVPFAPKSGRGLAMQRAAAQNVEGFINPPNGSRLLPLISIYTCFRFVIGFRVRDPCLICGRFHLRSGGRCRCAVSVLGAYHPRHARANEAPRRDQRPEGRHGAQAVCTACIWPRAGRGVALLCLREFQVAGPAHSALWAVPRWKYASNRLFVNTRDISHVRTEKWCT